MARGGKRIGRPTKAPEPGKRVSLGLKVRAEVKQHIDKAARDSGRTQSQEAELLIEKALWDEERLVTLKWSLEEIVKGNVEAALHRANYIVMRDRDGRKWWSYEPDPKKRSGFIDPDEGKQ